MSIGNRKMAKERPPAGQASILAFLLVGGVGMVLTQPAMSMSMKTADASHRRYWRAWEATRTRCELSAFLASRIAPVC